MAVTEKQAPAAGASAPRRTWGAAVFVWGAWAVMLLAHLVFLSRWAAHLPYGDEWGFWIPVLLGERPATPAVLWEQLGEHRVLLTRLSLLLIGKLSGYDFRVPSFVMAFGLGALSFAMIRVARRLRSRTSYADAFFPLALLHVGHVGNTLLDWGFGMVASVVLVCAALLVIVQCRGPISPGKAALVVAALVAASLYGAQGLPFVPVLAPWVAWCGLLWWRSPDPRGRRKALVLWGLALSAFLWVPIYFLGMRRTPDVSPHASSPGGIVRGLLQFFAIGFAPPGPDLWLFTGAGFLCLLLFAVATLTAVGLKKAEERVRALGLLFFLGAVTCLGLGVSWGRADLDGGLGAMKLRYVILSALLPCGLYFVGVCDGTTGGRLVQVALFVGACVFLPLNVNVGLGTGAHFAARLGPFERDLRAGMPATLLADEHTERISTTSREEVVASLRLLRREGIGVFRQLQDEVEYEEVSIPLTPAATHELTWENATGHGYGTDSYLTFALRPPRKVYAIRLRCSLNYGDAAPVPVRARVAWRRQGQADFSEGGQGVDLSWDTRKEGLTTTVWVNDVIEEFRIRPDTRPCVIRISEAVLLVPPTEGGRGR